MANNILCIPKKIVCYTVFTSLLPVLYLNLVSACHIAHFVRSVIKAAVITFICLNKQKSVGVKLHNTSVLKTLSLPIFYAIGVHC